MQSGSVIYTPQINVLIDTKSQGVIDVSSDIISFEMNRIVNGVSTFTVTLNNKNRKYSLNQGSNATATESGTKALIQTLDRIVVNMTRTVNIQVFSGYVTQAPLITILPNAVEISASCTIKRLQNTFWDSSVPEVRAILPGMYTTIQNEQNYTDGGAAQGVYNLLTKVANWDPNKIHIQRLPDKFISTVATQYTKDSKQLNDSLALQFMSAVDANGAGNSAQSGPGATAAQGTGTNYGWARTVLGYAKMPQTTSNQWLMVHWMAMEEPRDQWWNPPLNNPLNIRPGHKYQSLDDSAKDTAKTLTNGSYQMILNVLSQKNGSPNDFLKALQESSWDKNHYSQYTTLPNDNIPVYPSPGSTVSSTAIVNSIAQTAIQAALSQTGVPYSFAGGSASGPTEGNTGVGFDCSGLTLYAYAKAGITLPRYSGSQFDAGVVIYSDGSGDIPATKNYKVLPQPGDLVFYGPGGNEHVVMCIVSPTDTNGTNGVQVSASHTGALIGTGPMWGPWTGISRPSALNGNIQYQSSGISAQNSSNTSTTASSSIFSPDLFNTIFTLPQWNPVAQITYGTPRGFMMDEPVLNTVNQLSTAAFRNFQSLGNGDFVSWFPDYFGIYSTPAVLDIYNIEITDLSIYHNDDYLTTHVAVVGDPNGSLGQSVNVADWLSTQGIVSVQDTNIMNVLFGGDSANTFNFDSQAFLRKYGMRPFVSQQPLIRDHTLEFTYALMTFMQMWAQQYSTEVGFTFMPELYPGTRINFPEIIVEGGTLQLYVQSVTHSGSMSNGFTTRATVTAPSVSTGANGANRMLYLGFSTP